MQKPPGGGFAVLKVKHHQPAESPIGGLCASSIGPTRARKLSKTGFRDTRPPRVIAGLGGRLVCGYVTTGQYDVALVVEMPNGDAMTKLAVALTSRGNVRTTTVRAFSPEEFGKRHLDRIVPLRCGGANFAAAAASRGPIRCRRAAHQ